MITATLLVLFTLACLAMGGIRTWSDETQVERNALVFQGRNQAYGAFPLRRDYSHRLLAALITTFGLLTLLVALAKLVHMNTSVSSPPPPDNVVDVDLDRIYVAPPKPTGPQRSSTVAPPAPKRTKEDRPVEVVDSLVAAKKAPKDTALYPTPPGTGPERSTGGAAPTGGGQAGGSGGGNTLEGTDSVWAGLDVQELPAFPGGEAALQAWMQDHLDLPPGTDGRGMVFVHFTVMRDGSLRNVQAVNARTKNLEKAAERAVQGMPRWIPGRMNGHAVHCRLTLPIRYETR